jgi:hypothetical protein
MELSMSNVMSTNTDLLLKKAGIIERCCNRAREEYERDPTTFTDDST